MPRVGRFREGLKRMMVLDPPRIASLIIFVLLAIIATVYISQRQSELSSSPPIPTAGTKEQFETAKLSAEIRQIRSDTTGSLFWLKMIAVLVTVGGAVGGYLVAQSRATRQQLDFENRKNVDSVYQGIVQELSHESPVLRAAAAVKLGAILKSFPAEWTVNEARKEQIIQLTKQVLAAALSIEKDRKVLKTLTIALVLHKRWADDPNDVTGQSPSLFAGNIPFEFSIGRKTFPPGDYVVKVSASSADELVIIGRDANNAKIAMRPGKASKGPEKARLVFDCQDEPYALSEVWTADGYRLPKSQNRRRVKRKRKAPSGVAMTDAILEVIDKQQYADMRGLDLSAARAADAYWADVDFSNSDFYRADLSSASFRRAILQYAQFRETKLRGAVLVGANCDSANFKLADLRDANLTQANLKGTRFEDAKVFGCKLKEAELGNNYPDDCVDNSEDGDGTEMIAVGKWLERGTMAGS